MFETVLVPTDFSKYSQKVLECVGGLPGVKKVVLLNVIGPADPLARVWDPGARLKEAKKKLAGQAKLLEAQGLQVSQRAEPMLEGDIFRKIQSVSDEEGVNLVVMGARGKGFVQNLFLGNVAKNVLRYGDKHLLLMRYKILEGGDNLEEYCSLITTKVLCPTDFSEPSDEAINLIKGMKGIHEVVLFHVVSSGESQDHIDAKTKEATEKLNAMKADFEKAGIKTAFRIGVGSPADETIAAAEDEDVSLVAMSSHGKGFVKHLLIGSVAYEVAKNGTRPVLVLRSSKAGKAS
ncbi:universal stress protein [Candidatus Methanocrinis natronophilus]|uniref:Universal stress protein n=1 Tax=Candidatus Methanocrinis natronophilus TaxID=3033396 RepID=A0ABT5X8V4_9EURY|nr:universal stress protein [Candidatus Methanocrinis natronophilus]MDF0591100.1 universal stress protein [Candidatus Methanocrinis natronophilus]